MDAELTAGYASQPPDVVYLVDLVLAKFINAGQVADITAWVDDPAFAADKEGIAAFTWDVTKFDGKQYGVPLNVAYWVTFYNKHTFDKHKVDVPTTWDEFTGACEKLKAADVTPLAVAELGLEPGTRVWAALKATETEVYPA